MLLRKLAIATTLAVGVPTVALAGEPTAVVETAAVKAPAQSQSDAASYAQREKHDQKAANFQGGDLLVIGISGGAILVLLFLLLILA